LNDKITALNDANHELEVMEKLVELLRRGGGEATPNEEAPSPVEFIETTAMNLSQSGNADIQDLSEVTMTALREIKEKEDKISSLRARLQDLEDIRSKLEERRDEFEGMNREDPPRERSVTDPRMEGEESLDDRLPLILEESEAEMKLFDKKQAMMNLLSGEEDEERDVVYQDEEEDAPIVIENQADSLADIVSEGLKGLVDRFPKATVIQEEEIDEESDDEVFVSATTKDLQEMLSRLREASLSGDLEKMTSVLSAADSTFEEAGAAISNNSESLSLLAKDIAELKATCVTEMEEDEDEVMSPETLVEEASVVYFEEQPVLSIVNLEEQPVSLDTTLSRVQESITVCYIVSNLSSETRVESLRDGTI
jgi:hypothetical protein